jgi:tRNA1Val (adenine37-N6)-methyltransferase
MKAYPPTDIDLFPDEKIDEFMGGRLRLIQSRRGYRFSIDAILLAEFVTTRQGDRLIDLGTGCGIIPLFLLLNRPVRRAVGIEVQTLLASQASRNAALNGVRGKMDIIQGDFRALPFRPSSADIVTCNPPYRPINSGRLNPNLQRAIARHEILASLNDILDGARRILKEKGRLAMIYPAARTADTLTRMRGFDLEPKKLRVVYPDLKSEAKLVLIEASLQGRPGLKILPPLLDQGDYSIGRQV